MSRRRGASVSWMVAVTVMTLVAGSWAPALAEEAPGHHGHKSPHRASPAAHEPADALTEPRPEHKPEARPEARREPEADVRHEPRHEPRSEARREPEADARHEPEAEHESKVVEPGQVVSVFENMAEAAESTVAGGLFKFFELGPKVRDILAAHNKGDDVTAVASSIGTVTEYGLALMLFESLGIAELFMIDITPTFEWLARISQGVAGSLGVTKASEFSGEVVEKTTHQSLTGAHEGEGGERRE